MAEHYDSDYLKWIECFVPEELERIRHGKFSWPLTEECRQGVAEALIKGLMKIAWPVIYDDLLRDLSSENFLWKYAPGLIPEEKLNGAERRQLCSLKEKGSEAFADYAPVLKEKLQAYGKDFIGFADRMLRLFRENARGISEKFFDGKAPGPITGVVYFSTVINTGFVTRLEIGETKLIYKPRDCRIDDWFEALSAKYFSDCLYVPKVLAVEDKCGFFEYICDAPPDREPEALAAIRNLGAFAAVSLAFGSFDVFNNGNYLLCGSRVAPIDLEGIIHYRSLNDEEPELDLRDTLIGTGMILKRDDKADNTDVSPLVDTVNCSFPTVGGRKVTLREYPEQFKDGFNDIYHRCMALRGALISELDKTGGYFVRCWLINDDFCRRCIALLNDPSRLDCPSSQDYYLRKVRGKGILPVVDRCEKLHEIANECFKRSCHPYFSVKAGDLAVCFEGVAVMERFFQTSALDRAKECLTRMNEKDLEFEMKLLFGILRKWDFCCPFDLKQHSEEDREEFKRLVRDYSIVRYDGRPVWIPENGI